jgi:hypothetical protein
MSRREQKSLSWILRRLEDRNDHAGEDQQQFKRPTDREGMVILEHHKRDRDEKGQDLLFVEILLGLGDFIEVHWRYCSSRLILNEKKKIRTFL